jgi:hypothetical protein
MTCRDAWILVAERRAVKVVPVSPLLSPGEQRGATIRLV